MFKIVLPAICLLFSVLITDSAHAQISVELAGKQYTIPAINNTKSPAINPFDKKIDSEYMSYHVIEPLTSSPYTFEARCSYIGGMTTNIYKVNILKGNRDSLWAEVYTFVRHTRKLNGGAQYIELGKNDIITVFIKKQALNIDADHIIDNLIKLGLFTQPDIDVVLENLKNNNVKLDRSTVMDCCDNLLFDIKIGNHYRNFKYNNYTFTGNPNIKELIDANALTDTFLKITSGN